MNVERLLKLADYLENDVPEEHFFLGTWRCHTTACAIGHAVQIKEFANAGLRIEKSDYDGDNLIPEFQGHYGYFACSSFFGIDLGVVYHLFAPWSYDNVSRTSQFEVATRIRELIGIPREAPKQEQELELCSSH